MISRSANPALSNSATTKGRRAFCDAVTGGAESPLWVKTSRQNMSAAAAAFFESGHSDLTGKVQSP
jgi:hypothetical protein